MKKLSLLCITLMLLVINVTTARAAAVTVTGAGSVVDGGAAVNTTYTFTAGEYLYTIQGFGPGDVLIIPAVNNPSINQVDFYDGFLDIETLSPAGEITIRLTGLTTAQDNSIYTLDTFRNVFGAASLPTTMVGDANGDKKVDVFDALLVLQYALEIPVRCRCISPFRADAVRE